MTRAPAPASRPDLHLTAEEGWVNDPLALTYREGTYHLFFQHVPGQVVWGPGCHWGHATSHDLLHWTPQPVALSPGDGDDGCWSGGLVVPDDGAPVLFYTSVREPEVGVGRIRVATAADASWTTWAKGDVVAELPPGLDAVAFRDPYVFRDGSGWRMIVGAGLEDGPTEGNRESPTEGNRAGRAAVLGYSSRDLRSWTYDGLLAERPGGATDPVWTGSVWECPQLFRLGDRDVLVVSVADQIGLHYVAYATGDDADGRFVPRSWHRLAYGPSYYAASTFLDEDARRGLVFWLRDVAVADAGWAGAVSVPHVLTLDGDRLAVAPHPNLTGLHSGPPRDLPPDGLVGSGPVDVEWTPGAAGGELRLEHADGGPVAGLRVEASQLCVETSPAGSGGPWSLPFEGGPVRVLLDDPVMEVFSVAGVLAAPIEPSPAGLALRADRSGSARWWSLAGQ